MSHLQMQIIEVLVYQKWLYAIENNKEHRCNGDLSLHVLDIIDSTMRASQTGIPQEIKTTCETKKIY